MYKLGSVSSGFNSKRTTRFKSLFPPQTFANIPPEGIAIININGDDERGKWQFSGDIIDNC